MQGHARFVSFLAGGLLLLSNPSFPHGGQYRGPGDTVPQGGGGGSGGPGVGAGTGPAGPSGPTRGMGSVTPVSVPTVGQGPRPLSGDPTAVGVDLSQWSFWWEFNKSPYLNLKARLHAGVATTGDAGWHLGRGVREQGRKTYAPTEAQISEKVLPALLAALETSSDPDIVTGALVALAKIGDVRAEDGSSGLQVLFSRFLADSNQEIRETAAVALGILAHPSAIETLGHLIQDDEAGRRLVGAHEVSYRTRAFAAYGLGLIGHERATRSADRARIVSLLHDTLRSEDTSTRDLSVACIVAMGLVPVEGWVAPDGGARSDTDATPPPHTSLSAQIEYLLGFLDDEEQHALVRAHCPTALARLCESVPGDHRDEWRSRIASSLAERIGPRASDSRAELVQSCVLALGLLSTSGEESGGLRKRLIELPEHVADQQARRFALIALAQAGARPGVGDLDPGQEETARVLGRQLARGKGAMRSWAGLSVGVLGNALAQRGASSPHVTSLARALRDSLRNEESPSRLSAFALGAGLLGDLEAIEILREKLPRISDDEAQGYVAIALGLLDARGALDDVRQLVTASRYRPERLKQAAIALGLLGDKDVVEVVVDMLGDAGSLATQAALASALGFIGDQRAIDPLVGMLADEDLSPVARGFAAVALGIVAEKETLPWNSKLSCDLNYRAATSTLVDAAGSAGILDIL